MTGRPTIDPDAWALFRASRGNDRRVILVTLLLDPLLLTAHIDRDGRICVVLFPDRVPR